MRIARVLVALAAAAGAMLLPATAATAQPAYPPANPTITLSETTVTVGDTIQDHGTGYTPNGGVTITVTTQANALGRHTGSTGGLVPVAYTLQQRAPELHATADGSGQFTINVTLTEVGLTTITDIDDETGASASATVRVLPAGARLPVTGTSGLPGWAFLGAALAVTGVVLVLLARARLRRSAKVGSHA